MTRAEFLKAVSNAAPGERISYHVGFVIDDRKSSPEVAAVAAGAWFVGAPKQFKLGGKVDRIDASGIGAAHLIQHRYDAKAYQYQLVMRRPLTMIEVSALRREMQRAFAEATKPERLERQAA